MIRYIIFAFIVLAFAFVLLLLAGRYEVEGYKVYINALDMLCALLFILVLIYAVYRFALYAHIVVLAYCTVGSRC